MAVRADDSLAEPRADLGERRLGGGDLGGVFELANELAKGRCAVGIDADPKGLAATRADVYGGRQAVRR